MTTEEKLSAAIKLLSEVQEDMARATSAQKPVDPVVTADDGGSNPPGPGQPGKP